MKNDPQDIASFVRAVVVTVLTAATVFIFTAAISITLHFTSKPAPVSRWTSDQQISPPESFRIMMFPRHVATPTYDQPHGAAVGVLDHAMANALSEIDDQFIVLRTGADSPRYVNRDDLSLRSDHHAALAAKWRSSMKQRNIDAIDNLCSFSMHDQQGKLICELSIAIDQMVDQYTYQVAEEVAVPLSWHSRNLKEEVLARSRLLFNRIAGGAIAAVVLGGTVMFFSWRRNTRRQTHAAETA